jgi:hypothetical protein
MSPIATVDHNSYAMRRLALALQRTIAAPSFEEKERAVLWAAAWGLRSGVLTGHAHLRPNHVINSSE